MEAKRMQIVAYPKEPSQLKAIQQDRALISKRIKHNLTMSDYILRILDEHLEEKKLNA